MADLNDSKNNDRKLDEMLDAMLSAYSAVEPRPGLETRIVANVKEESAKRTSRWRLGWMWTGAIATAAAVILLMTYFWRPQQRATVPQIATQAPQKTTPAPELQRKVTALSATSHPKHARPTVSPTRVPNEVSVVRQEVFPSPSPLSEQEKLLLRYLSRTPRQELIAQSHPDPPEEPDDDDSREPRPQNLTQVPQRNSNTR